MATSSEARQYAPDEVLEFTRTFDAPLALVWRLWRDPEHMVRWYGPEGGVRASFDEWHRQAHERMERPS